MIDISEKKVILRTAKASGRIYLKGETVERIKNNQVKKGDVLTIAKVSAISAVKKVPNLIPLCHPIPITQIAVDFEFEENNIIRVICTVKSYARTGVEMEALTGVSVALLNLWDVVKMYEKNDRGQYPKTIINDIKVDVKIKEG
ncbi:MAG: cyclic pyranopterin monophosphate synthase MoaC [Candidatus Hodarchaeota archaeon]